ncbi:hypothetical protein AV530_009804 [Patagioenas fasciata monilis]|uniref:Uncharacterized protein n=1 Tax=Patagioenas fasciata monilis TaxID=372326 RepID=A0A1V4KAC5_PATFA|nr:hypothetical protein AV530_009804 [Patagioenas fasciata monilis]
MARRDQRQILKTQQLKETSKARFAYSKRESSSLQNFSRDKASKTTEVSPLTYRRIYADSATTHKKNDIHPAFLSHKNGSRCTSAERLQTGVLLEALSTDCVGRSPV